MVLVVAQSDVDHKIVGEGPEISVALSDLSASVASSSVSSAAREK